MKTGLQEMTKREPTIIISRKGFDSASGGRPSPIIGNCMVSLPIPADTNDSDIRFSCLNYPKMEKNDFEILTDLTYRCDKPVLLNDYSCLTAGNDYCHFDPQLWKAFNEPASFNASFGQSDIAQAMLDKTDIMVGDLFLFFGLFRPTERKKVSRIVDGKTVVTEELHYAHFKDSQSKEILTWDRGCHCLWGYMQIGAIIKSEQCLDNYPYAKAHNPHKNRFHTSTNNTIYIGAKDLDSHWLQGSGLGNNMYDGYGIFNYCDTLILTETDTDKNKNDTSVSKWQEGYKMKFLTYPNLETSQKDTNVFKICDRGQEFVVNNDDKDSLKTAKKLLCTGLMTLNGGDKSENERGH